MSLTQEELAEAFGVTIGAVSKWENGNNVPDIMTLMELANFFNVSVDELLGYNMSSKKVDDMIDRMSNLCHEYRFDEAISESNNALVRYPHNFRILHTSAEVYFLRYIESDDDQDRDTAINLYERCLDHLSQNTDNEISEYTIRHRIAELYSKKDPEKALETLKSINYDGCTNKTIASVLMNAGRFEEALDYGSQAILRTSADQFSIISNMAMSIAASGRKRDIEKAIEMVDANITLAGLFGAPDRITYMNKLQTIMLILKAWWQSCLGDKEAMESSVAEAFRLATLYDNSKSTNELSAGLRFYYSKNKAYSYDSTGANAVSGIESMFNEDKTVVTAKNYKYMKNVADAWYRIKEQA